MLPNLATQDVPLLVRRPPAFLGQRPPDRVHQTLSLFHCLPLSSCQTPIWSSVCSHSGGHGFISTPIWNGLKICLVPTSTSKPTGLPRTQITCFGAASIWSTHNSHITLPFMTYNTTHTLVHRHTHFWYWLESFMPSIQLFMAYFKCAKGFHPSLPWCVLSLYWGNCFNLCDTQGRNQVKTGLYQKDLRPLLLSSAATQNINYCVYARPDT